MSRRATDHTGHRFGRLAVVERDRSPLSPPRWRCVCDCGATVTVRAKDLRSGSTQSCGCLAREATARRSTTHAMTGTPEYNAWHAIHQRCRPCNPRYGGRGIKVSPRWETFQVFLSDMGMRPSPRHSIDRIDPNGDYTPENCRWATVAEQNRNKTSNRRVTSNGETLTAAEWAARLGTSIQVILYRMNRGWPDDKVVGTPVRHRRKT